MTSLTSSGATVGRPTQRDTVLAMLREGPVTTAAFLERRIPRFSARIDELRQRGFAITRTRNSASSFTYTLTADTGGQRSRAASSPAAATTGSDPRETLFDSPHVPSGVYDLDRAA